MGEVGTVEHLFKCRERGQKEKREDNIECDAGIIIVEEESMCKFVCEVFEIFLDPDRVYRGLQHASSFSILFKVS